MYVRLYKFKPLLSRLNLRCLPLIVNLFGKSNWNTIAHFARCASVQGVFIEIRISFSRLIKEIGFDRFYAVCFQFIPLLSNGMHKQ